MGEIGKVDPAAKIAALKPYVVLLEDKTFQAWLKTIEGELDSLKEFSWQIGGIDRYGQFDAALNEMKMVRPANPEEIHQVWMCFRAVANYWRSKLDYLNSMKLKYEFLVNQQSELQRIEAKDEKREEGKS